MLEWEDDEIDSNIAAGALTDALPSALGHFEFLMEKLEPHLEDGVAAFIN